MKRIKMSLLIIGLLTLFAFINPVYAAGTVTASITGNSTVSAGSNVEYILRINSVSSGDNKLYSIGGFIDFNSEYLQYVDCESVSSLVLTKNATTFKFALADYAMSTGAGANTDVLKIKFKALKNGSTTIGIRTPEATDKTSDLNVTVNSKSITIGDAPTTPTSSTTKSSDATLKSLGVTGQTLSPSFSSSTLNYTVTVPAGTTSVTLTGAANSSKATVSGLGNITLTGDTTVATVRVTAENGGTKDYKVTINRTPDTSVTTPVAKDSDATLKSLTVEGFTMSPTFNPNTLTYTVKVPNAATFVKISGAANSNKATVKGLGDVTLTGDSTTATVKVTAENGTVKTYTINIEKEEEPTTPTPTKSSDATLKSLDVSGYTLTPVFKSNVTTYSMTVQNTVGGLNVTAIPNDPKATVIVNGNKSFNIGVNTINITVIAEDGTTNNYTVNVTRRAANNNSTARPKSSDNSIDTFIIKSSHTITPSYSNNVDNYNVTVPYDVNELDMSIILNDANARYTVSGNKDFKVGEVNVVTIKVIAEDGTTRNITLNVTRSLQKDGTDLKDIILDDGELDPKFDPEILDYVIDVPSGKNKVKVTALPVLDGSKVEVFGNENLKDGFNKIKILVTDKNGYTKTYTINAYRKPATKIFGLSLWQFGILAGIIGSLLLLLLILLFARRKKDKEPVQPAPAPVQQPVIDFKPEFNFGSRNGTDDDIVYPNATLNQAGGNQGVNSEKALEQPKYIERQEVKEIPYDMYDEIVTKDELIDAIHEGLETKNPEKLKMLLEQEELNRRKEEIRRRDEENHKDRY